MTARDMASVHFNKQNGFPLVCLRERYFFPRDYIVQVGVLPDCTSGTYYSRGKYTVKCDYSILRL